MHTQSLEELLAVVEAEEAQANAVQAEVTEAESEEVEETEEVETEAEEVEQESEQEEGEAEEVEEQPEWAKAESDKEKGAVPVAKHVEIKHKLQGKIADKDAEIAALKQQLEQVQAAPPQHIEDLEIAKEAWEFDGPAEEYPRYKAQIDARNAIKLQRAEQQRQANEQRQREEAARVDAELDKHYERAAALVTSGIIKQPEQFQAAEQTVVKAVESVAPGLGQMVINSMISRMGEGSEKVIYHLGANATALREFESELRADPTGIKAAMYLAKKQALFNSKPVVKPKPVPKPDVPLQGKAPKVSSYEAAFKKAEKAGDSSGMLAASRAARAAGINPDNW